MALISMRQLLDYAAENDFGISGFDDQRFRRLWQDIATVVAGPQS